MDPLNVQILDLNFQNVKNAIASYLIPWGDKAILIESGPATTLTQLKAGLAEYGYTLENVSDVFVTHIHLDHAGAAGWLAKNGSRVHVHPKGARHLIDPTALLKSARRIYQDSMDRLWGEIIATPEEAVNIVQDGEFVKLGPHRITAIETPGHAAHHHAYVYEGICFSGDVGGVRIPGKPNLTLPMPPPEFNMEIWTDSIAILRGLGVDAIAPTHFGLYRDITWHLDQIDRFLAEVDVWLEPEMASEPTLETIRTHYTTWFSETLAQHGLVPSHFDLLELINPSGMSGDGLYRYWYKFRSEG